MVGVSFPQHRSSFLLPFNFVFHTGPSSFCLQVGWPLQTAYACSWQFLELAPTDSVPPTLLSWKFDVVEFHLPPIVQNCYMIIYSCKEAWEFFYFFFSWTQKFLKNNQNSVKKDKCLGQGQADSIWSPQRTVCIIMPGKYWLTNS